MSLKHSPKNSRKVINIHHGRTLQALVPKEHLVEMWELPGAGHNNMEAVDMQGMVDACNRLVDAVLARKGEQGAGNMQ